MFDIGWSEMAIILVVALIVIGPRDLPRVARTMGRWVAKGRAMAREFQVAVEDMAREAELDKVKKEIETAGSTNVGKTIERHVDPKGELGKAFNPNADDAKAGDAKAGDDRKSRKASAPRAEPAKTEPAESEPAEARKAEPAEAEPAGAEESPDRSKARPARPNGQAAERETVPAEPN